MPAKPKAGSVRSKYEFMKSHRQEFAIEAMRQVLGVAPSGYSAHFRIGPSRTRDSSSSFAHGSR